MTYKLEMGNNRYLKICDNGCFIIPQLYWALCTVSGIFDIHISGGNYIPFSNDWSPFYWQTF